jgi:pyruvate kinase
MKKMTTPVNLITDPCHTKIVCTLGPASSSEETLEKMILAGMDVVRLNFSHGEHAAHKGKIMIATTGDMFFLFFDL